MKIEPKSSAREVLAGLVERVTYQNAESGFCVVRVRVRGRRELVTLVGHAAAIAAGEWITATGNWVNDRTHGRQFKARLLKTSIPTSVDGIERYLASGMIRGLERVSVSRRKVASFLAGTRYQPDHLTEFCRKCSPCFRSIAVS
jgi:exodeoxyribonuclease V alpha subunit